ncbi:lysozyme 1 [Aphelenchoides avenae]|nr:lysozyme 1 [Aphelenchus avenae]
MPKGFTCDQRIDEFKFRSLKEKHGYEFYVGSIWRSTGKSDPKGIKNMRDAIRAGFTDVSAYLFPRFTAPARPQVENALNFLKEAGVPVNILWIDLVDVDVEDPSVWSRDKNDESTVH